MAQSRSRILVAEVASVAHRLKGILSAYDCTSVGTLQEAKHLLQRESYSLVVICMQFDESRMFDLIRHMLNDEHLVDTPIVCVRDQEGPAAPTRNETGIELSLRTLGAKCFLDLRRIPDTPEGNARISQLISHMLLLEADMKAYRDSKQP